ncbi:Hypothetical protein FKW44_008484 [Caligus rogercresseyi]|uniref:Uncharacterized protein n=1 Tax=Caligus rogercresseyi TaxID=217165 RepID=A0A7T8QUB0_CALRO|nr:Hypothetical protein FKW44_008484 [Caligus rogercresseyi]
MESYPSSDFVRELPIPRLRYRAPVPPLREWSPTPRRTSLESFPSLVFFRELPVPPLREWSPTPRRTSLESSPSLLFVNGALPLVGLR